MDNVIFLLFRRLRAPLIVLICTYAISVLGFVLIPGMDDQGRPWRMDFFHAFYFVSFMGSTIGFGEIPYPFTGGQRLWTIISIYATVFAWLYGIGNLLALIQDPAFRRLSKHVRFTRSLRRLKEPFFLICGYGDTGSLLASELSQRGIYSVVIDIDQTRIDILSIAGLPLDVPGLCADAADPDSLLAAGLTKPNCVGVVALTNVDEVNLTVAISSKLLAPSRKVICRAEYQDTRDNMASFGTDHIINPYDTFADRLALAIHSPSMFLIDEWMTSTQNMALTEPVTPPRGTWIVCGYGRFGKAVQRHLTFEGVDTVIIEADPEGTAAPPGTVAGRGTEAVTLRQAGVEQAAGIVAGTNNGTNNLSIIMTARELNPELFTVARQMHRRNDAIFEAADLDMTMLSASLIARTVLALIINPLLADFLRLIRQQDDDWANVLISRISGLVGEQPPDTWIITISEHAAPAVDQALREDRTVRLGRLLIDPREHDHKLACLPLMVKRHNEELLLPEEDMALQRGDQILFGGHPRELNKMLWTTHNQNVLDALSTSTEQSTGLLWRWLSQRR